MTGVTLTEFLLARIAEDEAITRSYARPGSPIGTPTDERVGHIYGPDCSRDREADVEGFLGGVADPDRVLAECDAKRRIVEMHRDWPVLAATEPQFEAVDETPDRVAFRMAQQIEWLTAREYVRRFGDEPPTAPILALLALPYADHPDYREEWKP